MSVECRKCGANPQFQHVVLVRVNKKGEVGIWECSPVCGVPFISGEAALSHALDKMTGVENDPSRHL